jgi:hypothetical protein
MASVCKAEVKMLVEVFSKTSVTTFETTRGNETDHCISGIGWLAGRIKLKFGLEQAMKGQRESRGVVLFFL